MNIKIMLLFSVLCLAGAILSFTEIQRFYTHDWTYLISCMLVYTVTVTIFGDVMVSITNEIRRRKVKKELDAERAFRKLGGE